MSTLYFYWIIYHFTRNELLSILLENPESRKQGSGAVNRTEIDIAFLKMTSETNRLFHAVYLFPWILFPFAVMIFLFNACMHNDQGNILNQMLTIDDRSKGSTLEVATGQSFSVEMRNPASGGYLFQEPEFDKNILQMRDQKPIPPPENDKRAGDFGRMIYIFKAIAPGSTEIVFRIYRPWEHDIPAKEYQRVKVVVTQ
jgi:predicted secreted protein